MQSSCITFGLPVPIRLACNCAARGRARAGPYTNLTLPTILSAWYLGGAVYVNKTTHKQIDYRSHDKKADKLEKEK